MNISISFMYISKVKVTQLCLTLVTPWNIQSMEFSRPELCSGELFPSPGDLPNPRFEPSLPHCRQILYQLSHKGSPRILECIAYPFPVDLPDSGIKPGSFALQVNSLPTELSGKPKCLKRQSELD